MPTKKNTTQGVGQKHARKAYEQCVLMRKKMNQQVVPMMAGLIASVNSVGRRLDIIAREVAQYRESSDA